MKRKTGCFEVIGFYGGFHGRTFAASSAGGMLPLKRGYGPAMPGVIRAPFPYPYRSPVEGGDQGLIDYCMTMLEEAVKANSCSSLAGLLVEPYLGAAGFIFPPDGYLSELGPRLRRACLDGEVLLRPLGNVLYAIPPASTTPEECDQIAHALRTVSQTALS